MRVPHATGQWGDPRDEGARREACCPCPKGIGVRSLMAEGHGATSHRERLPIRQDVRCDRVNPLCGMETIKAVPHW